MPTSLLTPSRPGRYRPRHYYYKALSSAVKLNDGTTYYLVFGTSQLDASNYYYLYDSYTSGDFYAAGSEYQWNGSSWVNWPGDDLVFITNPNGMPRDDNGHGTHCAGIVGAEKNGVGVIGTSRGATIMPLKAADCGGSLYDSDIINAIYYAADNGADIISMSFGGSGYSSATQTAVNYAYNKGVALFAAAGNSGDATMQYPAGYSNVIGVGATDFNDSIASFSTFNSSVDISAPGVDVYSTLPTYAVMFNSYYGDPLNYAYCSGTSMATPMAAGLAALVLSRNPKYTPAQVQQVMQTSADDKGSAGRDDYYGYGRINAYNTLRPCRLAEDRFAQPHRRGDRDGDNHQRHELRGDPGYLLRLLRDHQGHQLHPVVGHRDQVQGAGGRGQHRQRLGDHGERQIQHGGLQRQAAHHQGGPRLGDAGDGGDHIRHGLRAQPRHLLREVRGHQGHQLRVLVGHGDQGQGAGDGRGHRQRQGDHQGRPVQRHELHREVAARLSPREAQGSGPETGRTPSGAAGPNRQGNKREPG